MNFCAHCVAYHSARSCYSPTNPWGGALSPADADEAFMFGVQMREVMDALPSTRESAIAVSTFAASEDHRISHKDIRVLVPEDGVVCVVVKRAVTRELDDADCVPYFERHDVDELLQGVWERVRDVLPVDVLVVVTAGPIWQDRDQYLTPLRLLPDARMDEVHVEIDRLLQTTHNNALAGWETWSQRLFGERQRRKISGQPEYRWPDRPFIGQKESA